MGNLTYVSSVLSSLDDDPRSDFPTPGLTLINRGNGRLDPSLF